MIRKSWRFSVAIILLLSFSALDLVIADERADRVDALFSRWDRKDSPGCALAVVQGGRMIHSRGYGMANLELGVPITTQSVFYIGSVSKQFVAFCIALLAVEGKLSLDDDIRKILPEIPDYGRPITIRHLIHHTSGLRDYLALADISGVPFGEYHEADVLELIARQKDLNFKPGEEYLYSNSGYFLMGLIIERASGKTLREFAEEHIFRPLGMNCSRFHDDYEELIVNRASGYFPAGKGKYRNFISTFDCVGSGGLFTSVEDLYLWDQNFSHHKAGGRAVIHLMHSGGKLNSGRELDYAFALNLGDYRGLKTVSHGGSLGGYKSVFVRFPDRDFSVICLSNLSTFNPSKIAFQVADIYLAGHLAEEEEVKSKDRAESIKLSESELKEKTGFYAEKEDQTLMRVVYKESRLFVHSFGQVYPLAALSETEFVILESPVSVRVLFEKGAGSKPASMRIFTEGEEPKTYQTANLVKPTPEELEEYQGEYRSDKLRVTFRLVLEEGKLFFVHRNAPEPPLQPMLRDWFSVRSWRLRFLRDQEGKIAAFILSAGRVRNLRFDRKL